MRARALVIKKKVRIDVEQKRKGAMTVRRTSFMSDERGLSTVEYVIILVLIAAAAVGLWQNFGGNVKSKLEKANTEFDTKVDIGEGEGAE